MAGFGGAIKLTGESEYRKALKDITANLREVSSEIKLTSTQFTSGDKTLKSTKESFSNANNTIQEQKNKIEALRNSLSQTEKEYGANNDKVRSFRTQLNNAENQLIQMESATDKSTKELKDMKNGFDDAGNGALKFGDILKANVLGDAIVGGIKAIGTGMKTVATEIFNIGMQSVESYANYEQLIGGVETLFKDSSGIVQNYANNAYKTAGLSANEYMETVTSFSASLLQSLNGDTAKSAEVADMAITDMSDNANKMGTDMTLIQNAYQGFAKQNFTMLDNLKLGYGGTKEEMQRLLEDAQKISGVKYDISNLNDIYEAIHIIQTDLKISGLSYEEAMQKVAAGEMTLDEAMNALGTTAKEANTTIQGSVSAVKSAWTNLLTGIASGNADIGGLTENLVQSVFTAGENILPVIQNVATNMMQVLPQFLDQIIANLPTILESGKNILNTLINGVVDNLPKIVEGIGIVIDNLVNTIIDLLPQIIEIGMRILTELAAGIIRAIPKLVEKLPAIINAIVEGLGNFISDMGDVGKNLVEGIYNGIINAKDWLIGKIKQWGADVLQSIKNFFGINSPSKLLRDEVGINLALGVGEGFSNTMKDVSNDMNNAIPTSFEINSTLKGSVQNDNNSLSLENMTKAFTYAIKNLNAQIIIDKDVAGNFVFNSVNSKFGKMYA